MDLTKENHYRKSSNDDDRQSDVVGVKSERTYHRDSFETIKQKLSNNQNFNHYQRQQTIRRSGFYAKLKIDKPKKHSRTQEHDSEDENYRELDHIYDYIRSGDITDDVQRIQAKEQALNQQMNNPSKVCVSAILNVPNVNIKRRVSPSSGILQVYRFPHNLDDSRPIDDDDNISDDQYYDFIENPNNTTFESTNSKPITSMKRLSK
jgi:hypothetical protein